MAAQEKIDALKLYRQGAYEESVEVCLNELSAYDDSQIIPRMDSYTVLGWGLIRLGRYEEAVRYGEDALKWSRYDTRIIENLGEAHYYLGNHEKGLDYFQQYVSLNPTGDRIGQVYYYMGETYIRMGLYNHADIALSTAVYHVPSAARWWSRLGYAREGAEKVKTAELAYNQALILQSTLEEARKGLERIRQN
ncbi:tetratricopeptide repeat protein [Oceanispirochaeta crateris]|jgi:tetratricopeptide (TPR) repeat protein|uniref:Tetratricopeptide repeat protein n=2 Tax=Oceanispirochaeta crateris TaxID=2518645 RepID=A0A5C1QP48_9SPIO|nr:tetratricopeptide repeat protein [Oceanispirochaeta crateris]